MGMFDPVLGSDTPLFIDPLALPYSQVPEISGSACARLDSFFGDLYLLIRASSVKGDVAWAAARKRLSFHEISGTCLGYGGGTIAGSGWGKASSDQLLDRAKEIIALGVHDPRLFILLGLFSERGLGRT